MQRNRLSASFIRNFVFGVEDGLVSTVGLLAGIAIAGVSQKTILLTGIVLIFVEAFSMAAGSLLSEHSVEDYTQRQEAPLKSSLGSGIVMFFSYFFAGFVPLFPYLLFERLTAFSLSIMVSLIALFALGVIGGRFSKTNFWRDGLQMAIIGGVAVVVGAVIGNFVSRW
jgi:VIT1/CCC1 family predicted Fe2+/Mn2+ transporter